MKCVYPRLEKIYKNNLRLLDLATRVYSREEAEEFFNLLEKIYEAGIANENEYWRTYGDKS